MNILVIGNGAREHAICWRLAASPRVSKVFCAPGNPGIAAVAEIVPCAAIAVSDLLAAAERLEIGLTIVGPEVALAAGVVDAFSAADLPIVGPTKAAAMLESSKAFAKEIMIAAGVPTAKHHVFSDRESLERHCNEHGAPLVLKADGLASGKGVFVIEDAADFPAALDSLFGPIKAECVVVEEFLSGVEVSCIFAANGSEVIPLAPAHDYKRLGDNDRGPNTGGMGSVCPSQRVSESDLAWIQEHCAAPILRVMRERGTPFSGFLYAGLMVPTDPAKRPDGMRVLEYNTRLGDPECQAILVRLASDPLDLMEWIAGRRATQPKLEWRKEVSTCVVVASDGYPEAPVKGDQITGLDLAALVPSTVVFHAATTRDSHGNLVSGGGRTLSVVGLGADYASARAAAYKVVDLVQLRGRRVRRDIGA